MAVTVITGVFNTGEPSTGDFYANAEHFFEKDGHLYVVRHRQAQDMVALYKPGSWVTAYLGEKLNRKSGESAFLKKDGE